MKYLFLFFLFFSFIIPAFSNDNDILLSKIYKMMKRGEITYKQYKSLRHSILFESEKMEKIKSDNKKQHNKSGIIEITLYFTNTVGAKSYNIGKTITVIDENLQKIGLLSYYGKLTEKTLVFKGNLKVNSGIHRSIGFNYIVGDNIESNYIYNFNYYKPIKIFGNSILKLTIRYNIAEKSNTIDKDIRRNVKIKDSGFRTDSLNDKYENEYERIRKYPIRWKL